MFTVGRMTTGSLLGIKLPYDGCIYSFDVLGAKETCFLRKPGFELYQAKFAPDDRSVIVEAMQSSPKPVSKLFLVPLRGEEPAPDSAWIPVGPENSWNDKPRWAPDGKLVYFISDRDGYRCIWAQRINTVTGYPEGEVFNVRHFHGFRHSPQAIGLFWQLEFDVAKDKILSSALRIGRATFGVGSSDDSILTHRLKSC